MDGGMMETREQSRVQPCHGSVRWHNPDPPSLPPSLALMGIPKRRIYRKGN